MSIKNDSSNRKPPPISCKECMSYEIDCGGRAKVCESFVQRFIVSDSERRTWPQNFSGSYGFYSGSSQRKSLSQEEYQQLIVSRYKNTKSNSTKSQTPRYETKPTRASIDSTGTPTLNHWKSPSYTSSNPRIPKPSVQAASNKSDQQKSKVIFDRKAPPITFDDVVITEDTYYLIISNYLLKTYAEFLVNLKKQDSIRTIKGFVNRTGQEPNYSIKMNQQIHELRFFLPNFMEYFVMYSKWYQILSTVNIQNQKSLSVLSLGCGSTCDYFALCGVLNNQKKALFIDYLGIDRCKWTPVNSSSQNHKRAIEKLDLTTFFKFFQHIFLTPDIIVFPKSIGEVSQQQFDDFISHLASGYLKMTSKRISILGSFEKKYHERDKDRYDQFINILKEKFLFREISKFSSNLPSESPMHSCFDHKYPEKIRMQLTSLQSSCSLYQKNKTHCKVNRCPDQVLAKPVNTTENIDYEITILERD